MKGTRRVVACRSVDREAMGILNILYKESIGPPVCRSAHLEDAMMIQWLKRRLRSSAVSINFLVELGPPYKSVSRRHPLDEAFQHKHHIGFSYASSPNLFR
jgi:hypothetical protein